MLRASADPTLEDAAGNSPLNMAWERTFKKTLGETRTAMPNLFNGRSSMDIFDSTELYDACLGISHVEFGKIFIVMPKANG